MEQKIWDILNKQGFQFGEKTGKRFMVAVLACVKATHADIVDEFDKAKEMVKKREEELKMASDTIKLQKQEIVATNKLVEEKQKHIDDLEVKNTTLAAVKDDIAKKLAVVEADFLSALKAKEPKSDAQTEAQIAAVIDEANKNDFFVSLKPADGATPNIEIIKNKAPFVGTEPASEVAK